MATAARVSVKATHPVIFVSIIYLSMYFFCYIHFKNQLTEFPSLLTSPMSIYSILGTFQRYKISYLIKSPPSLLPPVPLGYSISSPLLLSHIHFTSTLFPFSSFIRIKVENLIRHYQVSFISRPTKQATTKGFGLVCLDGWTPRLLLHRLHLPPPPHRPPPPRRPNLTISRLFIRHTRRRRRHREPHRPRFRPLHHHHRLRRPYLPRRRLRNRRQSSPPTTARSTLRAKKVC